MGKIRVHDLAAKMGIADQDLIFKLKSIGVRVEGEDAHIDTEVVRAILEGKKLPQPREVILRDEAAPPPTASAAVRRRTPPRRVPTGALRPVRRRTMIQKVEPKIKTLPAAERPVPTETQAPAALDTEAAVGTLPAMAPASEPGIVHVEPEQIAGSAGELAGAAAAPSDDQLVHAKAQPEGAKPPEAAAPQGQTATRPGGGVLPREKEKEKRARRGKKAPTAAGIEDLRAYRGPIKELAEEPTTQAVRPGASNRQRRRAQRKKEQEKAAEGGKVLTFKRARPEEPITLAEGMTVREFADKLGVKTKDLIKQLLGHGIMASINHVLEPELAKALAEELGVEALVVSFEEEVQLRAETRQDGSSEGAVPRGPVVTIMGHVDHGKTSLLDAIRSSKITEGEFGGITQHIGAYHVEVGGRNIVFLDTPGHEAFTKLRARGAQVTDVVVLVVAADDGVMPQTTEAIDHAQAAQVPIVVAINKMDRPNANPERVKADLAQHELMVEEWGGETVAVGISALNRQGIDELLDMILLTADLLELKADPEIGAQGVILEARKEPGRGTVATLLVQSGTLRVGDLHVSGSTWGRVRSMVDDRGGRIQKAGPSTAVEVAGFDVVPQAGDTFQVVEEEAKARSIAEFRSQEDRKRQLAPTRGRLSLEGLFDQIEKGEVKELPLILKADVQGSVEVLRDSLAKLSTEKVQVRVIRAGVGAISTQDVLLASASKALVYGFNVRPERNAVELADKEEVEIRTHTVIYELADELRLAMTGLLEPTFKEVNQGRAEVREIFKVPRIGSVAGCHVVEGTIPRSAQVRLLRDSVVVYEGKIGSLRRFKDDVSEVRSGFDCGIGLERFQDVKPGDFIEAFVREEVAPTL